MIEPLRLEVIRHALSAIANEVSVTLARAAYSTNIKTRLDYSCALLDRSGRIVAQAMNQPTHLGALPVFVPKLLQHYGVDRLEPGDGILSNDGHLGGLHLNDACLVTPLFNNGQLIGHIASMAHHVDIGGGTPGSIGLHREIFQEGLVIPPTRLVKGGAIDDNIFDLIVRNVRAPRETGGDLRAQLAGAHVGERRVSDLIDQYGQHVFLDAIEQVLDHTERRVRAEINALPQGTFSAVDFMDDDGFSDVPIRIAVKVTVGGGRVVFDLSDSDTQRPCSVNTTHAMAYTACAYALKALIDPDISENDGFYRLVELVNPPGLVTNALRPAAIGAGIETGHRICETVFRAFADVMPTRVVGDTKGTACNIGFGGIDPRSDEYFVFYECQAGGYGARATKDGIDAIQPHIQNTENSPVEETEANYPMQIVRYELIKDSEGAGRFRGGMGVRRDYRPEGKVTFTVMSDRSKHAPQGIAGGGPARGARFVRNPDGAAQTLPSKFTIELDPGEILSVQTGGGGGYGSPSGRDPQAVQADLVDERISAERARTVYGLALDIASAEPSEAKGDGTSTGRQR